MTGHRRYAVLFCLAVTILSCAHVPSGVLRASRMAVNGVTVGSSRSTVLARLGTPLAVETGYDDIMDMGGWEKLTYPGLVVEVIRPEPERRHEFFVARVVITERSWRTASGLRVGDPSAVVRQLLGVPERVGSEEEPYWYYATAEFDGGVVVTFREDEVIEIRIDEDWT